MLKKHNLEATHQSSASWSLITVTYNSRLALERFWGMRNLTEADFSWIVVDNASTDGSPEFAQELGANVIRLRENRGFGAANNIGYQSAEGDYIGFVNPDVMLEPQSLPRLRELAGSATLVAPQLFGTDAVLQPNGRGRAYLRWQIGNRVFPSRYRGKYLITARPNETVDVAWLTGAAVLASRETWNLLSTGDGPWDEAFFVYYEDSDLGERAKRAGVKCVLDGGSQWKHGWARESASVHIKPWLLHLRSMSTFFRRYPELLRLGIPQSSHQRIIRSDTLG